MRLFRFATAAGKLLFPSLLWNIPVTGKTLYLTFDDGPVPEITPWLLSLLKDYNAKATFFCIGENVEKHPAIFRQILDAGHRIGNHTHNHLNGWKTSTDAYIKNTLLAKEKLTEHRNKAAEKAGPFVSGNQLNSNRSSICTELFRPPFGKITPNQVKELRRLGYKIIMWEVISGDYDIKRTPEECYKEVISQSKPGSILVFHDSFKASGNLKKILPKILEYYKNEGFAFKSL